MNSLFKIITFSCFLFLALFFSGCSNLSGELIPGPDKQAVGTIYGAAVGAGSGAVIGNNLTAATGPGALIGAGAGAVIGMLKGIGVDFLEEDDIRRKREQKILTETSWAQGVLAEHYERRLELHPNRDIFPADVFFESDSVEVRDESRLLLWHLAKLTKNRMPWSRIIVTAYATTSQPGNTYSQFLTEERAKEIATYLVRGGLQAKRVSYRAVTLQNPILIDPDDSASRYRQAIEIIPLDY